MKNPVVGPDTDGLRKMFHDYVENTGGRPRHTREADYEVGLFSAFTAGAFPNNLRLQSDLHLRMMDCAVEFEESGFMAGFGIGFQCALSLLQSQQNPSRAAAAPAAPEPKKRPPEPVPQFAAGSRDSFRVPAGERGAGSQGDAVISSKKIAELFETSNAKVVKRIEAMLPTLDAERKQYFRAKTEYTIQHRRHKVFYLNYTACEIYLREMEPHRKYVNIAGGLVKMRELMKSVFPAEADAS